MVAVMAHLQHVFNLDFPASCQTTDAYITHNATHLQRVQSKMLALLFSSSDFFHFQTRCLQPQVTSLEAMY